jgi:plastocyanin
MNRFFKAFLLATFAMTAVHMATAAQHTVTVQNFSFNPANLTIAHGDTVIWNNTGGFHNVHHLGNPSLFGNTAASAPWTYQFVFSNVGDSTFHYDCEIHPSMMQGTVTVQPPSSSAPFAQPSPVSFSLDQNYPNPFNPVTHIHFDLANAGPATLDVFNVIGQKVAELVNAPLSAGSHTLTFDASSLPSGVYLYRLAAGGQTVQKKMMLLK